MLNPSSPLLATTYYYNPHRQGAPTSVVHRHHDLLKESVDQETCPAADGRDGTCYDAVQCLNRGGTPMGRCEDGVCCVCKKLRLYGKLFYLLRPARTGVI